MPALGRREASVPAARVWLEGRVWGRDSRGHAFLGPRVLMRRLPKCRLHGENGHGSTRQAGWLRGVSLDVRGTRGHPSDRSPRQKLSPASFHSRGAAASERRSCPS